KSQRLVEPPSPIPRSSPNRLLPVLFRGQQPALTTEPCYRYRAWRQPVRPRDWATHLRLQGPPMTRKSFLTALSIVLVLTGGTSATLYLLVRHEPEAYSQACPPPGQTRAQLSREFYAGFLELYNACTNKDRELDLSLTAEQINSYFVED